MGSAYTPGLTVSGDITVRRVRRLPIKGEVLVQPGDVVKPDSVVARALLPGALQTIKLAEKLGVPPRDAVKLSNVKEGDLVEKGQVVVQTTGFLGLFRTTIDSDYSGTVEAVSEVTGNLLVREASIPVEVTAYVAGHISQTMPDEGAVVETRCAMVQGIFGVGGERNGVVRVAVSSPDEILDSKHVAPSDAGKVLVGGAGVTYEAMSRAGEVGAAAIIAGCIKDSDLTRYLGYDVGVAITGQEAIPITVLVTEGFGVLPMAKATFKLLKTLEGREASVNGATQIRAGVIRPEVLAPIDAATASKHVAGEALELKIGAPIRVIREPYFGKLGSVTELPPQLVVVDSGAEVRVLKAKLDGGEEVTVPRANVEIIAH